MYVHCRTNRAVEHPVSAYICTYMYVYMKSVDQLNVCVYVHVITQAVITACHIYIYIYIYI